MYGGTDGEGEPLYGMAPMEPEPAEIERKPHESGNVVLILVDSGASSHYFDDMLFPDLKRPLQDYNSFSTLRTILTAGGALLDAAVEGVLQGLIADDYGEQELAQITILIVPGIGSIVFSAKPAARKGIISIFDVDKSRLKAGDITVPLHGENDGLYFFKLGLSADGYAGNELAMNEVTHAQV